MIGLQILWLLPTLAQAQGTWRAGLMPQVNVNLPLAEGWRLNTKLEVRPAITQGEVGGTREPFAFSLADVSALAATRLSAGQKLAVGYLLRYTPNGWLHRSMQQFSAVTPLSGLRLAHRVAADQTFGVGRPGIYRGRYRLSAEIPLNGTRADSGEPYVKIQQENLLILQDGAWDGEVRLVPVLGYHATEASRLELGLDWRYGQWLQSEGRYTWFLTVGWFWRM